MNTQELIENTVLYSLSLLDEQEQAAYESALLASDPGVRASVRAEALRMADLGDLLPDDQPSAELRDMVVAAVRAGMREQEVEQRIASERAAPAVGAAPGAVAGRIGPDPARRRHAQPALPRSRRVHPIWRAAAIGLTAATIALTVVSVNIRGTYNAAAEGARIAQLYDTVGAEYVESTLFDPNTRRVTLAPVAADPARTTTPVAAVWHNPDWQSARLFVKNLRPQDADQTYRLVVLDEAGNIVREVHQFRSTGELQDIGISVNLATENRLAIYQGVEDAVQRGPLLLTNSADL
jgi:hypothetical protein